MKSELSGMKALITGGLGMLGSSIARRLALAGADVDLCDSRLAGYGGNEFNLRGIRRRVRLHDADIRDRQRLEQLVRGRTVIFSLAGQVSHNESLSDPFLDAAINYTGQLNVLEAVRRSSPQARVLYAGSRLQYGRVERNPVDEEHPQRPLTPYALNKSAAESMYLFYHRLHGLPVVAFRIANPYGPRGQMRHGRYCIVNWFVRQALEGGTIRVYGDGSQVRDYLYIDDLVEAFVQAAVDPAAVGQVFNVGSGQGTSFRRMAEMVVARAGAGRIDAVPWPEDYVNVETGDYVSDIRKIGAILNWRPRIGMAEGIGRTVRYYRRYRGHYV